MIREYESLLILKSDSTDDEIEKEIKKATDFIEAQNGSVIQQNRWGKKRLAHTIAKQRYGFYLLLHYSVDGEAIGKINRQFKLNENILKSMSILFDHDIGPKAYPQEEGGEKAPLEGDGAVAKRS